MFKFFLTQQVDAKNNIFRSLINLKVPTRGCRNRSALANNSLEHFIKRAQLRVPRGKRNIASEFKLIGSVNRLALHFDNRRIRRLPASSRMPNVTFGLQRAIEHSLSRVMPLHPAVNILARVVVSCRIFLKIVLLGELAQLGLLPRLPLHSLLRHFARVGVDP